MLNVKLCVLTLACAALARGGEVSFSAKPAAAKDGDKVKISFTLSAPADVEVAVLGADGKVVRSLAAGVLGGPKPPPEPLKPGLAQELVWDGKGDWNLPAGAGPFKVRVRAGMGAKFGRTVGDSPYNFYEMYCGGMAVDPANGDLYYLARRGRDANLFCLRVYDRTGKHLREIMPYPASIDAKSREAYGSLAVPGSETPAPLNRVSLWPVFYPMASGAKLVGLNPAEPETLVLMDESFGTVWRVRKTDGGAGSPFAEAIWDGKGPGGGGRVGPVMGAVAPDGKAVYFTGYCLTAPKGQKLNPSWPEGRIYKMEPGKGKAAKFADVELPEAWRPAEEPWATPANGFQALHGIAVDKDGNVLVCDAAGGKVRIFSSDGKESGAIDAPGAYVLTLDPKSGALYVLTRAVWRDRKLGANAVVKYESAKPGAKAVATLQLGRGGTYLAGDFSGAAPQLWVADAPAPYTPEIARGNLLRIEEKNGKLEMAEDLAERGKTAAGFAMRIDVDQEADLVYINNGWSETRRYNGLTGEYAGKLAKNGHPEMVIGSELCVRRDGMVYVSGGGGYAGPWERFNRDLSPAPLADGKKQFADRYGKMGGGYFGNQGSCVTPDGHLYFNGMFSFRINAIFELNPDGSAGRCPRLQDAFATGAAAKEGNAIKTYAKHGLNGVLIGSVQDQSGGLEIDQKGCLYVGLCLQVQGHEPPPELAKVRGIGAVVKFGPDGGAMLPDPDKVKPGAKYECYKNPSLTMPEKIGPGLPAVTSDGWAGGGGGKKLLEGALKAYPLLAPFSYEGCACQTPRFEVDDFGRLYIPNAYTCSVRVVDNEGNEITRFGSYGNFDDGVRAEAAAGQKTDSAAAPVKPAIPLAYPVSAKASFKHIYVADSANRRVVRVDPTWKAEESCEVK
jgi:DNA-binding beta-propeller fold protein YncE